MNCFQKVPLTEVADIYDHLRKPISQTERNKREGIYPYFGATGQIGWINDYRQDGKYVLLGEDGAPFLDPQKNKAYIVEGKCWVNNHAHILKGKKGICDDDFLCFALNWTDYSDAVSGSTRLKLPQKGMQRIFIPLPSMERQRQIVTRIKARLAEVKKAHKAVKVQLQDSQFLKSAILKETFTNHDSKKWPAIRLGEAGDVVAGITLGRKVNGKATRSIPYLRVANVKDGHLDLSDVKKIEATDAEIERLLLRPGDILLTEGGDPDKLGRGTFWSGELDECIHQNHIFRVRFPQDSYLPEFIAAQIGSIYGKGYFFSHAKQTTGIATINQTILKNFPVLSPPIETQKTVMAALTSQLDEVEKMIVSIKKQLHEINQLPQKILAQAFEIEP